MKYATGIFFVAVVSLLFLCNMVRTSFGNFMSDFLIGNTKQTVATNTSPKKDAEFMGKQARIQVGNRVFVARLEESPTTEQFIQLLPMETMMRELNGNEKYVRLSISLPTEDENPVRIHAGDLMLYNGDTVVLFYKDFSTSYRYTRLGCIADTKGLQEAVGNGDSLVKIEMEARQ